MTWVFVPFLSSTYHYCHFQWHQLSCEWSTSTLELKLFHKNFCPPNFKTIYSHCVRLNFMCQVGRATVSHISGQTFFCVLLDSILSFPIKGSNSKKAYSPLHSATTEKLWLTLQRWQQTSPQCTFSMR
jgi:hypothetical protein